MSNAVDDETFLGENSINCGNFATYMHTWATFIT